ncbi:MAG: recombinase family protein, partial [Clostridiales bacterium]|nr:recombinase family protein [Clostridiales bacterium]
MAYCIYLRKSRKDMELEQYGVGETLTRHKTTLIQLAERVGYDVKHIYEEIKSGDSIALRPQMQKLLLAVEEKQWEGVLVMELERLARGDTRDQATILETFKYTNTLIITPNKIYNPADQGDEEYFEFGLFMSRREYNTIKRRMNAGRLASVKEGNFIGSVPPYGYDKVKTTNKKGYTLDFNSETESVKLIFDLFTNQGYSILQIADKLDALGIKPRKSQSWSTMSLRDLLNNPTYTGKLRWNWRKNVKTIKNGVMIVSRPKQKEYLLVEGKHPAIISNELFEKTQVKLKENSPKINKKKKMINPFVGIAKCGKCGKYLTYRKYPNEQRMICENKKCNNGTVVVSDFQMTIFELLHKKLNSLIINPIAKCNDKDFKQYKNHVGLIKKELFQLNNQKNKLYDFLERNIYTEEVF